MIAQAHGLKAQMVVHQDAETRARNDLSDSRFIILLTHDESFLAISERRDELLQVKPLQAED